MKLKRHPEYVSPVDEAISQGQAALDGGRYKDAVSHFKRALQAGRPTREQEALIRCKASEALEKRGLFREQLETMKRYSRPTELADLSSQTRMFVLIRLGRSYLRNNDIPRAIALLDEAKQLARSLDDDCGLGHAHMALGTAYGLVSEVLIARDHFTAAMELFRRVGRWQELAYVHYSMGVNKCQEGEYSVVG